MGRPNQAGAVVAVLRLNVGAACKHQLEQGGIGTNLARRVEIGALLGLVLDVHVGALLDQLARLGDPVHARCLE